MNSFTVCSDAVHTRYGLWHRAVDRPAHHDDVDYPRLRFGLVWECFAGAGGGGELVEEPFNEGGLVGVGVDVGVGI